VLAGAILGIGLGLVVSIFGNKLFDKLSWLMTNKETPEK
jgi:hypothetical protein